MNMEASNKVVRVHQLHTEEFINTGFIKSFGLPFVPTGMTLNQAETAFVLKGEHGVLIGNFPTLFNNIQSD